MFSAPLNVQAITTLMNEKRHASLQLQLLLSDFYQIWNVSTHFSRTLVSMLKTDSPVSAPKVVTCGHTGMR